jgi:hypothetical protein
MMNAGKLMMFALVAAAVSAGCNRAESPQKTANDVAEARQDAAKDNQDAARDAARDNANNMGAATDTTAPSSAMGNSDMQKSEYDMAVTRAEGDHKVAIEKCEAMGGAQQKACKSRADAELDTAKANAKTAYPNH